MTNANREIIANIPRLEQHLDEQNCSALVLRSGKNFTYLSGFAYPGTLGRHLDFPDSPREVLLVWPRQGDPVLILNSFSAPLARRDSWLQSIETYDDYAESPYEKAAEVLKRMGWTGTRWDLKRATSVPCDGKRFNGSSPTPMWSTAPT